MALSHDLTLPPKSPPKSKTIISCTQHLKTLTSPPRAHSMASPTCSRLVKAPRHPYPKTQLTSPPMSRPTIRMTSPTSPPPIRRATAPILATSAQYHFPYTARAKNDSHYDHAFLPTTPQQKRVRSFTFSPDSRATFNTEEENVEGMGSFMSSSSVDPSDYDFFSSVFDANVFLFSQVGVEDALRAGAHRFQTIPFRTQAVGRPNLNTASCTTTTTVSSATAADDEQKEEGSSSITIPKYFSHHGQRLRLLHDQCFLALELLDHCHSYAHLISELQRRVYKHYAKTGVILKTTGNIIRVTRYIYIDELSQ